MIDVVHVTMSEALGTLEMCVETIKLQKKTNVCGKGADDHSEVRVDFSIK